MNSGHWLGGPRYTLTIERTYLRWIKRFIFFHKHRNPLCMGKPEIEPV